MGAHNTLMCGRGLFDFMQATAIHPVFPQLVVHSDHIRLILSHSFRTYDVLGKSGNELSNSLPDRIKGHFPIDSAAPSILSYAIAFRMHPEFFILNGR
jgi:hypothetical protein